jgi:hypothetical protein
MAYCPNRSAAKSPIPKPFLTTLRLDLARVESGVPIETMSAFAESYGIPLKDMYDIVIPARTLKHRRELLSRDESDKLALLVRVFDHAASTAGRRSPCSAPTRGTYGRGVPGPNRIRILCLSVTRKIAIAQAYSTNSRSTADALIE